MLGVGGGRADHELANILLLADTRFSAASVEGHSERAAYVVLTSYHVLPAGPGDLLTLLPIGGDAVVTATTGLRWPLRDAVLHPGVTWGVSNEVVAAAPSVTIARHGAGGHPPHPRLAVRRGRVAVLVALAAALLVSACGNDSGSGSGDDDEIRVLTHRGAPLPADIEARFEDATGATASVIVEDDVDALLALLGSNEEPWRIADVVVGIDSLAVTSALPMVEAFRPAGIETLDEALRLPDDALTPLAATDVCVNYDRSSYAGATDGAPSAGDAASGLGSPLDGTGDEPGGAGEDGAGEPTGQRDGDGAEGDDGGEGEVEGEGAGGDEPAGSEVAPPASLLDLTSGTYSQQLVLPDPAVDRIGAWFVAATHTRLAPAEDESQWLAFIAGLRRNGFTVTSNWRDAYFGRFTAGNDRGDRPLVVASALMPAVATRYWLNSFQGPDLPLVADTAVIADSCAGIVEYAGVVAGTPRRRLAGRFMDLLVAPESQITMYDDHGSRPARTDLVVPPEVDRYGIDVDAPLVDPEQAGAGLDRWLEAWADAAALEQADAAAPPPPDGGRGDRPGRRRHRERTTAARPRRRTAREGCGSARDPGRARDRRRRGRQPRPPRGAGAGPSPPACATATSTSWRASTRTRRPPCSATSRPASSRPSATTSPT